jgi:phage shock protein PspC (stress-responsive transcriptional regulator)
MTSPLQSSTAPRRLYRSRSDRKLAGVLGGLAEYAEVDAAAMRVIFLILAVITGGAALLAYPLMWLVMPEAPAVPAQEPWLPPAAA